MSLGLIIALIYGVIALAGGVGAYFKVKSKASLISGIISGSLLLLGVLLAALDITGGLWVVKLVTLALVVVFVIRLIKTKKFMPAGLMLIGGLITLAGLFLPVLAIS